MFMNSGGNIGLTSGHEKMSKINTKNREGLKFPHDSGAKPFIERRIDTQADDEGNDNGHNLINEGNGNGDNLLDGEGNGHNSDEDGSYNTQLSP